MAAGVRNRIVEFIRTINIDTENMMGVIIERNHTAHPKLIGRLSQSIQSFAGCMEEVFAHYRLIFCKYPKLTASSAEEQRGFKKKVIRSALRSSF